MSRMKWTDRMSNEVVGTKDNWNGKLIGTYYEGKEF